LLSHIRQQIEGIIPVKLDVKNYSIRLFYLLVATDLVFIILHIIHSYSGILSNPRFSLELDRGYGELFQYLKEYWILLLFGFLAVQKRSPLYLAWSLLFSYRLLDDSLSIHENLGRAISNKFAFSPALNLRAKDFGELVVSASVGLFFLILISIAYRFGDRTSRKTSKHLIVMLFGLALFGIVVDMIHIAVQAPSLDPLFNVVEDGGEMVVMSLIASFVFLLPERSSESVDLLQEQHLLLKE
jgi:hypothetical protein